MALEGTGEEWKALAATRYAPNADDARVVEQAKRNIARLRMDDATLRLVDRAGRPLAHHAVHVEQLSHAFAFGDQLWPLDRFHRFGQHEMDRALAWRTRFEDVFNAANALCYWTERPLNDGPKMEDRQGEPRIDGFAWCVDWARSRGMYAKGHPLFWSIPKCVPDWVQRYDVETQMRFAEVRVRNLVARFRGRVRIWDAVNEPLWEAAPKNLSRRNWPHLEPVDAIADYVAPVLRWCREEDPDATYLINDYGLEHDAATGAPRTADGVAVTAALQRRRMLDLVRTLRERGTPPDAIGMQAHTAGWLTPGMQWAVYDDLAQAGLPLHVSEFWADLDDLLAAGVSEREAADMQAQYVADYLTCAFGHDRIDAFFFWGFMDQAIAWHEHSSHTLRPMYERVRRLIREEWHTTLNATTDSDGVLRFRGFHGDYAVRTRVGDRWSGQRFTLQRGAAGTQTIVVGGVA